MSKKRFFTPAIAFIILMGFVSMLSDMTHEGAKSIYGQFLSIVGASPKTISLISGLGEFIGCSLIIVTAAIANKTKKYWLLTFIGYAINLLAIPALSLTLENGWIYAASLIIMERIGKAIRKPSKNTLVSFASNDVGAGKAFALQEFLDQLGAFIGPIILTLVIYFKGETNLFSSYKTCFLILGIPAIITLLLLIFAMIKYPDPENTFEKVEKEEKKKEKFIFNKSYLFYLIAISLSAASFIDFPLINYYVSSLDVINETYLPLLYSLAMLVDAFAALLFGFLFDKIGLKTLIISTIISSFFAPLIFITGNMTFIILGIILWGVGMGAQESILKAAVATIVPKNNRALGYGIFEFSFGLCWFIGSLILGYIYEYSLLALAIFSCVVQLLAIPAFILSIKYNKKKLSEN